jgi:hypothetical protein
MTTSISHPPDIILAGWHRREHEEFGLANASGSSVLLAEGLHQPEALARLNSSADGE